MAGRPHGSAADSGPTAEHRAHRKKEIQTRLELLSRPEVTVGEAYEKSALVKPKARQGEL